MTASWSRVRVVGPLEPYAGRFAGELLAEGFTDLSTAEQLRLMGHLSRWLGERGMPAAALDGPTMEEYCRARREQGYTARLAPSGLGRLLGFLQGAGVVTAEASPEADDSPDDRLVVRYRRWLVEERALVEAVVAAWCKIASLFLGLHPGLSVGEATVGTGEVTRFCVQQFPGRSSSVARNMAAGLRTFLRFLHLEGLVAGPLAQAVPAVANRQGAGLPRFVAPGVVARLLAGCDRRTCRGRRDYAILLLLARLGLRAGEVARLSIDDIDWRAGELIVHGKGGPHDRMPLPCDVGEALVGYLRRGRPKTAATRMVFVRMIAPRGPLSGPGVTWVVYSACERAGVAKFGAHRLRHTTATGVLASGGSIVEVAQVLRHSRIATSAIYAKVDFAALAPLARPWPGGVA